MSVLSQLGPMTRCRIAELCVCCVLVVACVLLAVFAAVTRVYTITGTVVVIIYALRLWRLLPSDRRRVTRSSQKYADALLVKGWVPTGRVSIDSTAMPPTEPFEPPRMSAAAGRAPQAARSQKKSSRGRSGPDNHGGRGDRHGSVPAGNRREQPLRASPLPAVEHAQSRSPPRQEWEQPALRPAPPGDRNWFVEEAVDADEVLGGGAAEWLGMPQRPMPVPLGSGPSYPYALLHLDPVVGEPLGVFAEDAPEAYWQYMEGWRGYDAAAESGWYSSVAIPMAHVPSPWSPAEEVVYVDDTALDTAQVHEARPTTPSPTAQSAPVHGGEAESPCTGCHTPSPATPPSSLPPSSANEATLPPIG